MRSLIILGIILFSFIPAQAYVMTNPGFEAGNTSGWTVNYPSLAAVLGSHAAYTPQEGSNFLRLAGGDANIFTMASQDFTLNANESLVGYSAFDAQDYLPFDDYARVYIFDGNTSHLIWQASVASVGDYGDSPWTTWSWNNPGTYNLQFIVANVGDSDFPSYGLFDTEIVTSSAVPEPATMSLLGFGLLGLLGFKKRK